MDSLAKREVGPIVEAQSPILDVLRYAVEKGMDVAAVERIAALYERFESKRAEAEYSAAKAAFLSECPVIRKTTEARNASGVVMYRYAELEEIICTIGPVCAKHGLSYSWDSSIEADLLTCVCTIRHSGGHSETARFTSPIHGTSMMSSAQKAASALTFGRRQSLIQALGLVTGDRDDDGAEKSDRHTVKITEHQAANLDTLIENVGAKRDKFLEHFGIDSISDLPAHQFSNAVSLLEARRKAGQQ